MKYEQAYNTCPVCGSKTMALLIKDFRDNSVFHCSGCDVQFMNPVYTDQYLADYYAGYYGGGESDENIVEGQDRTNAQKYHFIEKYVQPPGSVLDFGCGNANFALFAKQKGWHVTGYDVDCDAMGQVSSRYDLPIKCGPLSDVDWREAHFDLIHAHHVVEHLKEPVRDLKILHGLLADEGYLYIGVPNIYAWSARVKLFFERMGLKKSHIGKYYDSDHHVFYYTPRSMKNLLDICGFEVVLSMNGAKSHMSESKLV